MSKLIDIDGREAYVVIFWGSNSMPTIVGVCDSSLAAATLMGEFIGDAPDPAWEKTSGQRRNNTWIEAHSINSALKANKVSS